MKTNKLTIVALIAGMTALTACGGKKETVKAGEEQQVAQATELSKTYNVDVASSTLGWTGTKVTGKHFGKIGIQSGTISVEKNEIKAGSFVIDMKTITVEDLTDEEANKKLAGHLASPDFFDVEKHATSKFEITGVEKLATPDAEGNNYKIMGNLTIKDVTKNITIPANITMDENQFSAKAKFSIDRTEWNIQYGSGKFFKNLGDKMINDAIEFDLNLVAKP
jgi:polyisoprenoid-binding protein YceI